MNADGQLWFNQPATMLLKHLHECAVVSYDVDSRFGLALLEMLLTQCEYQLLMQIEEFFDAETQCFRIDRDDPTYADLERFLMRMQTEERGR